MEAKDGLEVVDVAIPISAVLAEKDGEELVSVMERMLNLVLKSR